MALNKVIVIGSQKGGVGKTSSVAALADNIFRHQKRSVLVIDTDPMGYLSCLFGYPPFLKTPNSLSEYLKEKYCAVLTRGVYGSSSVINYINKAQKYLPRSEIRNDYDNLDIISGNGSLIGIYSDILDANKRVKYIFREFFDEIRALDKYDYVFVDTRPGIDDILFNIMLGADYLLVPSNDCLFSFKGANNIVGVCQEVYKKREVNRDENNIALLGMFLNMITLNTKIERDLRGDGIKKYWGEKPVFGTIIEFNQSVINAENLFAPVTTAFPSSIAAKEFNALAREVVAKVG